MERFIEGVKHAMFRPINKAAVSIMGAFTMLWGFWVVNPFWNVFTTAPLFQFMASVAPEWAWGLAALVVGAVIIYGVVKMSYRSLISGAQTGFYFWLFASISFFIGDWQNTGGITLLMIALYCGYVALNLAINKEYFYSEDD